jgi:hypothetical protein
MTKIKTPRPRQFGYTEEQMANALQRFIQNRRGLPGIGRFSKVFREIDCQQGRPDFIALAGAKPPFLNGNPISVKLAGSLVLSLLHESAPRTVGYLCENSGLSLRSVQLALAELVTHHYAKRTDTGAFVANSKRSLRKIEVVAIELKLDRPRRALFQAQQACSFAQRVLIVVPPSQASLYGKYAIALRRWGIGLATFEPETDEFVVCRSPRSSKPRSKQHQAYAMFQLLHGARP